jgi:hypothetical protein
LGPCSSGKKGRDIASQIPARGGVGGGEELAHEHQVLKARPGVGLGRERDDRRTADRSGGGEELDGEGFPSEEGGQVLVR